MFLALLVRDFRTNIIRQGDAYGRGANMKMKWLWTTWATVAAVGVVALNLAAVGFSALFVIPKMQKIEADRLLEFRDFYRPTMEWMLSFLDRVRWAWDTLTWWVLPALVVLWGLFEWRVRSENKPLMRLSALGTLALALTVVVVLTAGSLVLPVFLGLPAVSRFSSPTAFRLMATIDASVSATEEAVEKNDWDAAEENEKRASREMDRVTQAAGELPERTPPDEMQAVDLYLARLKSAKECLREAHEAIGEKDAERVKAALHRFHDLYGSFGQAAATEK
jgi:hypothetical protein